MPSLTESTTERWLQKKKAAKVYRTALTHYQRFLDAPSLDAVLAEREERAVTRRVQDFVDSLYQQYAPNTIRQYTSAVKSWYRRHGIQVGPLEAIRIYTERQYKVFTKEEINAVVDVADPRTTALTLCAYQSGSRISALCLLNYGDVRDGLEAGELPLTLHFAPTLTKYNVAYTTFLGEEAVHYLRLYLAVRQRGTEDIPPETLHDASPLFVKALANPTRFGRVTPLQALRRLKRACRQAGIRTKPYEVLGNHAFRNAFQRELQVAGVNQVLIEKLMGHKGDPTTRRYSIGLSEADLREAWQQADFSLRPSEATVRRLEAQAHRDRERYETRMRTLEDVMGRWRLEPGDVGALLRRVKQLETRIKELEAQREASEDSVH